MTIDQREWIDRQNYIGLLNKWRHEPIGSGYFCDKELYEYFKTKFDEMRNSLTSDQQVAASKAVGWNF